MPIKLKIVENEVEEGKLKDYMNRGEKETNGDQYKTKSDIVKALKGLAQTLKGGQKQIASDIANASSGMC